MRGAGWADDAIPAGALSARVSIAIDAPGVGRAALEDLARWAVEHCPVTDSISRSVPLDIEIR